MRNLVGRKCCLVLSKVKLQMIKPTNISSLMVPALERQISGHLPASASIENQTDLDTFLVTLLSALCIASFCWSSLLLFGLLTARPSH